MNGFDMIADDYRKMAESGKISKENAASKIRIYEFLGSSSQEDFYRLFDSSAFNDIVKSYMRKAVKKSGLDKETEDRIMNELRFLLDETTSKEICEE